MAADDHPRKDGIDGGSAEICGASMWPRMIIRGRLRAGDGGTGDRLGFNVAADDHPRKVDLTGLTVKALMVLQCGRG